MTARGLGHEDILTRGVSRADGTLHQAQRKARLGFVKVPKI
jgi:hypothetical protein